MRQQNTKFDPDRSVKQSKEPLRNDKSESSVTNPDNEKIPESQGDLADRAQMEIDNEIAGEIDRARHQH